MGVPEPPLATGTGVLGSGVLGSGVAGSGVLGAAGAGLELVFGSTG